MATVTGTAGDDLIAPGGSSLGVSGPTTAGDDRILGSDGTDTIDGGGGFDTLDYSALVGDVVASFVLGSATKPGGTDTFTNIERIVTGAGDDTITMAPLAYLQGSVARRLFADAGLGTNTISGASTQVNFADFLSVVGPVTVNLTAGTASATGMSATLSNVRAARGTDAGDRLLGNAFNNSFLPGRGNNSVDGGAGFDLVDYRDAGAGITWTASATTGSGTVLHDGFTDTVTTIEHIGGSTFDDVFNGGAWNEWFNPNAGNDIVNGNDGYNNVSYHLSGLTYPAGATINLEAGIAIDPWGGTDTLFNIQAAQGSPLDDTITGLVSQANYNFLRGMGGNDTIRSPTAGANTNFSDYSDSEAGVVANLATGIASDGWGGTDTLVDIRGLRGSRFDDVLTGSGLNFFEYFVGSRGNDTIDGGAVGGRNRLDYRASVTEGGIGYALTVNITGGHGNGSATKAGGNGTDTLTNITDIWTGNSNDTVTVAAVPVPVTLNFRGYGGDDMFNFNNNFGARVDYGGAASKIVASLASTGTVQDGDGGTDTLINVLRIRPSAHNDTITGWSGADTIDYGVNGGNKTIAGGDGTDTLIFNLTTRVVVDLKAGTVVKYNAAVGGTVVGTDIATDFESVRGGDGDDTITGTDGDDMIFGGRGNDTLDGGLGRDTLIFNSFTSNAPPPPAGVNVDLYAGTYVDPWGGIDSFTSFENVSGTQFADSLSGDGGANILRGLGGNDWIAGRGAAGGDTLDGGDGDDELWGNAGVDTLLGGNGNDILRSQGGADVMVGGAGDDQYVVFDGGALVTEAAGGGLDTVWSHAASHTLAADTEIGRLLAANASLFGSGGNDILAAYGTGNVLDGGGGDDELWGGGNADALHGSGGNDILRGGGGDDFLDGSAGNDQLVGGEGADVFSFDGGSAWGYDQVFDFNRAEGDRLLVEANGGPLTSLAAFVRYEVGRDTALIAPDGSRIDLYGVTGLTDADFIFA